MKDHQIPRIEQVAPRLACALSAVAGLLFCLACGGTGHAEPGSTESAAKAGAHAATVTVTANPDVTGIPFLGDAKTPAQLTAAGWTCGANEIGNMDCSRSLKVDGVPAVRVSLGITFDNQVGQVDLMATKKGAPATAVTLLATQLVRIATVHGWRCQLPTPTGPPSTCDKSSKSVEISTFPGDYPMASVRDPAADGKFAD